MRREGWGLRHEEILSRFTFRAFPPLSHFSSLEPQASPVTDLLQWASDWLEGQRAKHATRIVTYRRGVDSVDLPVSIGRTEFEIDAGIGVLERTVSRDYLLTATDLVLGGWPALPRRGDRIEESDGTTVYIHEVMAPGKEPAWRYSDPYRKTLRIHTKLVERRET